MRPMTINAIIATAKDKGYVVETKLNGKVFNGIPRVDLVKHECPDCKDVYTRWAKDHQPVPNSYIKAIKLTHKNADTVVACQCGYRKIGDRVVHSPLWSSIFVVEKELKKPKRTKKPTVTKPKKETKRDF